MAWKLPSTRIIEAPEPVEIDGVRHPANIFTLWSEAKLAAIGITVVPNPTPSKAEQEYLRAAAYREEADPLLCAWLKSSEAEQDSTKAAFYKDAWKLKISEIKARYPYPEA